MLLSVPLRADGTFDEKEKAILDEFGAWMQINKESIVGTRPWVKFGEGPVADADIKINAQGFNEGSYARAAADEIRFTQTDKYLYVTALAWPKDGKVVVKSLAAGSDVAPKRITRVELLGHGRVPVERTAEGLIITLPAEPLNRIAPVFKIRK